MQCSSVCFLFYFFPCRYFIFSSAAVPRVTARCPPRTESGLTWVERRLLLQVGAPAAGGGAAGRREFCPHRFSAALRLGNLSADWQPMTAKKNFSFLTNWRWTGRNLCCLGGFSFAKIPLFHEAHQGVYALRVLRKLRGEKKVWSWNEAPGRLFKWRVSEICPNRI